jgi:hypothetical protein
MFHLGSMARRQHRLEERVSRESQSGLNMSYSRSNAFMVGQHFQRGFAQQESIQSGSSLLLQHRQPAALTYARPTLKERLVVRVRSASRLSSDLGLCGCSLGVEVGQITTHRVRRACARVSRSLNGQHQALPPVTRKQGESDADFALLGKRCVKSQESSQAITAIGDSKSPLPKTWRVLVFKLTEFRRRRKLIHFNVGSGGLHQSGTGRKTTTSTDKERCPSHTAKCHSVQCAEYDGALAPWDGE